MPTTKQHSQKTTNLCVKNELAILRPNLAGARGASTVCKQGYQLFGIARGRQTGVAGADESEWFVSRKMRKGFFEGTRKSGELRAWSYAEDGFAEAEDAVRGFFEGLGGRIVGFAGDYNLNRVIRKERCSEAVSGGEKAVLRSDFGKGFKCSLREGVVTGVASESVHSNEGNGSNRVGTGRG